MQLGELPVAYFSLLPIVIPGAQPPKPPRLFALALPSPHVHLSIFAEQRNCSTETKPIAVRSYAFASNNRRVQGPVRPCGLAQEHEVKGPPDDASRGKVFHYCRERVSHLVGRG